MSAAMGPITAAISQSISQVFQQVQAVPPPAPGGKGSKATPAPVKPQMTDIVTAPESVSTARKRACLQQAQVTRSRKCTRSAHFI